MGSHSCRVFHRQVVATRSANPQSTCRVLTVLATAAITQPRGPGSAVQAITTPSCQVEHTTAPNMHSQQHSWGSHNSISPAANTAGSFRKMKASSQSELSMISSRLLLMKARHHPRYKKWHATWNRASQRTVMYVLQQQCMRAVRYRTFCESGPTFWVEPKRQK